MKPYYYLTKPGIIRGNLLTATAGFCLASQHHVVVSTLLAMLIGTSLIIASACVCNNYLDRDIDQLMDRTRGRALATGQISASRALSFAAVLGIAGGLVLAIGTNWLTTAIGIVGFIAYVAVYGFAKRRSVHGTVVGSISGAIPPVAGYTAATNQLDHTALLLFLILVCWQMPHFYAIAMYRLKDYKAAHIPVLPAVHGMHTTKQQIMIYIVGFTVASGLLATSGPASMFYGVLSVGLGLSWLAFGFYKRQAFSDAAWARRMFFYSLFVISLWSLAVSLDALI